MPNNYYRLLRVLEILLATGRPRSELNLDTAAPLTYDFRCFFLDRPRAELYRRIDMRCEEMLRDGLLQVQPRLGCFLNYRTALYMHTRSIFWLDTAHLQSCHL